VNHYFLVKHASCKSDFACHRELEVQIRQLEGLSRSGVLGDSERQLFEQLQAEMEGSSTQIGRKSEQLRLLEEDILSLEKRISEIEAEIEKLYEKHNVSKAKADLIQECDAIANVLNQFIVRLRKNKIHLLQEKTFEMYRLLSSRSSLIKDITVEYALTLPNVVHAEESLFICSTEAAAMLAKDIRERGLNRVVVAACTPRTHEPLFRDTLREAGINQCDISANTPQPRYSRVYVA
jgi:dGTP triphosphohydrolase